MADKKKSEKEPESVELSNLSERARKDYALVLRAVNEQDQDAYRQLLERYREPLLGLLTRMVYNSDDAEDLMMESFARAFKRLHLYQPNYAFTTWLFRIATNRGIDFIRKRRLDTLSMDNPGGKSEEEGSSSIDLPASNPDPEEQLIIRQKNENLLTIINQLKPRYQRLIMLRYYEEKTYEEISKELGVPMGTVKAQLYRAKELLLQLMDKKNDSL
jgi:RNA polymerase sigma factor (sigma-70 family)